MIRVGVVISDTLCGSVFVFAYISRARVVSLFLFLLCASICFGFALILISTIDFRFTNYISLSRESQMESPAVPPLLVARHMYEQTV